MTDPVKDRNKSAFPFLEKGAPLRIFALQVEAVKTVNARYLALENDQQRATFEVAQLLLASSAHPEALEAICDVAELQKNGEFNREGVLDSKAWLDAAWKALRIVCDPFEQDERDRILHQFITLPQRSADEFSGDVAPLITAFRHLKALAANYEGLITDAESARILISCLDSETAKILRLTLKAEQKVSAKVVEAIQTLAEASGGRLGNNDSASVRGDAMFVTSLRRIPPPARQRHRQAQAPGGRQPGFPASTPCDRCGREGHCGTQCPARNGYCRYCNNQGHFERVCKKKQRAQAGVFPTEEARPPTAGGAVASGVQVVDACCPPDDEYGWIVSESSSLATSASSSVPWFCDTGCTDHVVARRHVEGCILRERPKVTKYWLAKRGLSFEASHEAAVLVEVTGADGGQRDVVLKLNISADSDVPALIKPHHLRVESQATQSWATLRDYYGALVKVRIDDPMGTATGSIPSFRWKPKAVDRAAGRCLFTHPLRAIPSLTQEVVHDWHVRLLHPGALRLRGTLREQGFEVSDDLCRTVTAACTTCHQKNAVTRTPPPSSTRRSPEQPFNHQVVWDLGHISEPGYGGEHTFSLLVDEATLTWRAKALKAKSSAPAHLLEWIHEEGSMNALQSDNAGELKSTQVQLICRESNVLMVVHFGG
eukprot:GHVU01047374.1.p1 GENE.GHVU01047374.1~~GHVU01047374.1.p1  ORF type:complete len:657 (-),score=73.78 GHVU01047374.1:659-2629(-)